jgi:hypothetical protein
MINNNKINMKKFLIVLINQNVKNKMFMFIINNIYEFLYREKIIWKRIKKRKLKVKISKYLIRIIIIYNNNNNKFFLIKS